MSDSWQWERGGLAMTDAGWSAAGVQGENLMFVPAWLAHGLQILAQGLLLGSLCMGPRA